ncbi:MAG: hypothetical protein OHK0015_17400 [Chloroflexi bacterium OHK40]|uniref:hypothetical protein n=1 Tax=Chloroflexus sp. TaxID=1904827 RepID=UPI002ACE8E7F|nr:hypothetical protein [Chloroflexus sp.]
MFTRIVASAEPRSIATSTELLVSGVQFSQNFLLNDTVINSTHPSRDGVSKPFGYHFLTWAEETEVQEKTVELPLGYYDHKTQIFYASGETTDGTQTYTRTTNYVTTSKWTSSDGVVTLDLSKDKTFEIDDGPYPDVAG